MLKRLLCVMLAAILSFPAASFALFENWNTSVKATGMVDTFCVLGDEPVGMLYNPAQTVQLKDPLMSVSYSEPNVNWGDLDMGLFSLYWSNPMKDIKAKSDSSFGFGGHYLTTNMNYNELVAVVNYALMYKNVIVPNLNIAWGVNGKLLSLKRGDPSKPWDPALEPVTQNRGTADIGLWGEYRGIVAGASIQNITKPDFGIVQKSELPAETRIGLGVKDILAGEKIKLSPAIEYSERNGEQLVSLGLNARLLSRLHMQFGYSKDNLGFGATVFVYNPEQKYRKHVSDSGVRLDVSWLYPISGLDSTGSPQVGLVFKF